jgi:hypothetical protein
VTSLLVAAFEGKITIRTVLLDTRNNPSVALFTI